MHFLLSHLGVGRRDDTAECCCLQMCEIHLSSGFRVQGAGFRVQGAGFRLQASGFGVQGRVSWCSLRGSVAAFRCVRSILVQGTGFMVQGSGFRVQGSGFRVQGSGFKGVCHEGSVAASRCVRFTCERSGGSIFQGLGFKGRSVGLSLGSVFGVQCSVCSVQCHSKRFKDFNLIKVKARL